MMSALPESISSRLALPLIVAPMFEVSGPNLVLAACRAGAIGAFPTANCQSLEELDAWLERFDEELGPGDAPYCPNVIVRHQDAAAHVERICAHGAEVVITSVGSPAPLVAPLHKAGCFIFADVASMKHARRAISAGADGLVLLTAGAGGQTGWANGYAFARAVRRWFNGPLVLAGGVVDGQALLATQVLGCDLAYMGTRFIATKESLASRAYKEMLVRCEIDDVVLTSAISGLPTSILRPSLVAAGLDPDALSEDISTDGARALYGVGGTGPRRWSEIWSAGHAVSGVNDIPTTSQLVARTLHEYEAARRALR